MGTIKTYQEQVQDIVAKAISTVEEQHKAIAAASFEYIERLYKLDTVKAKHDEVADIAYSKAREINKIVSDYTADLISKIEKDETKAKAAVKKTTATAKKKATAAKATATKAVKSATAKVEEATA
tara:strand:+ start:842 stop:1216 length:375 start_codon:yes stop_codon:yes gene_type:complete